MQWFANDTRGSFWKMRTLADKCTKDALVNEADVTID